MLRILKAVKNTKVTLGRKVLVPGVGLEPTTIGTPVLCSKLPAAVTSPDHYSKVAKRDVTAVRSLPLLYQLS